VDLYDEGVATLERQSAERAHDPYPLTGLVHQLINIAETGKEVDGMIDALRKAINVGLRRFRGEAEFEKALRRFVALERKISS
jgi:hypothetical protein